MDDNERVANWLRGVKAQDDLPGTTPVTGPLSMLRRVEAKVARLQDTIMLLRDVIEKVMQQNDVRVDDAVIDDLCDAALKSDAPLTDRIVIDRREIERLQAMVDEVRTEAAECRSEAADNMLKALELQAIVDKAVAWRRSFGGYREGYEELGHVATEEAEDALIDAVVALAAEAAAEERAGE